MTATDQLTDAVADIIMEHLSLMDHEELAEVTSIQSATVAEIEAEWNEWTRDLSHLSRDDRRAVLARSRQFTPRIVDGVAVHVYTEVQGLRGQERRDVVIVDLGDARLLAVGY